MDTGTKTYQVDKHKQLIPLNGTTAHFSCFFEVKSKEKKPFNITIVEQGEIKPKQYKLVDDGYINGQLESDGQLKSYFLVLKSQEPCECDVRIIIKQKEVNNVEPQKTPQLPLQQPSSNNIPSNSSYSNMVIQQPSESYFQTKYIIGISAVLIIIYFLYKYRKPLMNKLTTKDKDTLITSDSSF
jgi:hypothetical protein